MRGTAARLIARATHNALASAAMAPRAGSVNQSASNPPKPAQAITAIRTATIATAGSQAR